MAARLGAGELSRPLQLPLPLRELPEESRSVALAPPEATPPSVMAAQLCSSCVATAALLPCFMPGMPTIPALMPQANLPYEVARWGGGWGDSPAMVLPDNGEAVDGEALQYYVAAAHTKQPAGGEVSQGLIAAAPNASALLFGLG